MKKSTPKTKKNKLQSITSEEIYKNIGFLGTKGALLKALLTEKKIEKLK